MKLLGSWCGKCDAKNMLGAIEATIAGNHLSNFPEQNKLPYCPNCGEQVEIETAEEYSHEYYLEQIPYHLDEAISILQYNKHCWKNREYVTSRLLMCQNELRRIMFVILDMEADAHIYKHISPPDYKERFGSYGMNCHAYRIERLGKSIWDLNDLLHEYDK